MATSRKKVISVNNAYSTIIIIIFAETNEYASNLFHLLRAMIIEKLKTIDAINNAVIANCKNIVYTAFLEVRSKRLEVGGWKSSFLPPTSWRLDGRDWRLEKFFLTSNFSPPTSSP